MENTLYDEEMAQQVLDELARVQSIAPPQMERVANRVADVLDATTDRVAAITTGASQQVARVARATGEHKVVAGLALSAGLSGIGSGVIGAGSASAASAPNTRTITVTKGDTEWGISSQTAEASDLSTNTVLNQIRALNPSVDPRLMPIGSQLVVPVEGNAAVAPEATAEPENATTATIVTGSVSSRPYIMPAGQTVWGMGQQEGYSVAEWAADNPGVDPSHVYAGKTYNEPIVASAPVAAPAPAEAPAPAAAEILIRSGETTYFTSAGVAAPLNGITVDQEVAAEETATGQPANGLKPGTDETIPAKDAATAAAIEADLNGAPAPAAPAAAATPAPSINAVVPIHSGDSYSGDAAKVIPITGLSLTAEVNAEEDATKQSALGLTPGTDMIIPAASPAQAAAIEATLSAPVAPTPPAATENAPESGGNVIYEAPVDLNGPLPISPGNTPVNIDGYILPAANNPVGLEQWNESSLITSPNQFTADEISQTLAAADPFMAGWGPALLQASQISGINPWFIAAECSDESGHGTSFLARTRDNYFGIDAYTTDPDAASSYSSPDASMLGFVQLVATEYLTPGGTYYNGPTIAGVYRRYSTSGTVANYKAGLAQAQTLAGIVNGYLAKAQELGFDTTPVAPAPTPTTSPSPETTTTTTPPPVTTTTTTSPPTSTTTITTTATSPTEDTDPTPSTTTTTTPATARPVPSTTTTTLPVPNPAKTTTAKHPVPAPSTTTTPATLPAATTSTTTTTVPSPKRTVATKQSPASTSKTPTNESTTTTTSPPTTTTTTSTPADISGKLPPDSVTIHPGLSPQPLTPEKSTPSGAAH